MYKPRFVISFNIPAQFYTNQGKHINAAAMFERAFAHYPKDYDLTFNLANSLRQAKDGEQAEVYYKKAVEIQPDVSIVIIKHLTLSIRSFPCEKVFVSLKFLKHFQAYFTN